MTSWKTSAFGAAAAGLALSAVLVLGEGGLRLYNHFRPSFIFYDDDYNRFRAKPFSDDYDFKLNSRGFKDVEFAPAKKPNSYRILGLGDSFAFGVVPYRYNYYTVLEEELNRGLRGVPVEVVNMGIVAMGPRDYLSQLVHEGLPLSPDLVIVSFFVGNDFMQCGDPASRPPLLSRSHLGALFRYLFAIRPKCEGLIIHRSRTYCDDCPSLTEAAYLEAAGGAAGILVAGDANFPRWLDRAVDCLRRIGAVCRRTGIRLLVVLIPDESQVDPGLAARIRSSRFPRLRDDQWNSALPNELFSRRLREAGIDCLDLLAPFVQASRERRLYRPRDVHWNIAGNRLAADLIRAHIEPYLPGGSGPAPTDERRPHE